MNNQQLYVLLMAMIAELDNAIAEAEGEMPEDAERVQIEGKKLKDEYAGRLGFYFTDEFYEDYTVSGNYVALTPLLRLSERWDDRIKMLLSGGE